MILKPNFTYIDLFAGIGGFHCAMDAVSSGKAKCIFASEIDAQARKVYKDNFGIEPLGDIRLIDPLLYPAPDVVCGGFPCQTFSKAGNQKGLKDSRGTLFREIVRIVTSYPELDRPKVLLLENVRNLVSHDGGETWKIIRHEIEQAGYNIPDVPIILAPKDIGVPQLRDRAIIMAVRADLFNKPLELTIERKKHNVTKIESIISDDLSGATSLTPEQSYLLTAWDAFINGINTKVVGFPIWSDEFGKSYSLDNLPEWKRSIIEKNRKLYLDNKQFIDKWFKKYEIRTKYKPTMRKFEWQAGTKMKSVFDGIIQFRTSGIRVKLPTESPSLVAMVHLPIIGPLKRTISVREAARLQSFPDDFFFNESSKLAFKQLGNAVNVRVIEHCFRKFLKYIDKKEG